MKSDPVLIARAAHNARLMRKINNLTLSVAIAVYVGLLGIAAFQRVGPLAIFSSCIMLAEVLVFQIVRTLSDHLDLVRNREA